MKNLLRITWLSLGIWIGGQEARAQLIVNQSVSASDAVQNVLLGGGVEAQNITFGGVEATQIGSFQCNNCGIGLASGIILGSGAVSGAVGPNNSGSFSQGPPDGVDGFGDPDLASLSNSTINNAAILEFDFIPLGSEINFNFVFSSEEYPEYVNSINDAFGFFISGPGITGPYLNGAANIALIPGTTSPVTINTVNNLVNTQYYVANHTPGSFGEPAQYYNVQPDGFTTVLTAHATVECGETYHIKIAIGDASDGVWDSWVFLEEGSFSSEAPELGFQQPDLAPDAVNGIYEGCGPAPMTFYRPPCSQGDYIFEIEYGGTAINGLDYTELPTTLTIPDGENSVVLLIQALEDELNEGIETLDVLTQITLFDGEIVNMELHLLLYDHPPLGLTVLADDNDVCPDAPVNLTAIPENALGGASYLWSTGHSSQTITVSSFATQEYSVTLTDGCGYELTKEHTVDVLPYDGDMHLPNPFRLCMGIPSGAVVSGAIPPYTFTDYNEAILEIVDGSGFYSEADGVQTDITITDMCGNTISTTILIYACDTEIPNIFTPNSDSKNARFEIKGIEAFPGSSLYIYDRWGKIIYESNDYRNNWSALEEGEGIYYYVFKRSDGVDYAGYVHVVK